MGSGSNNDHTRWPGHTEAEHAVAGAELLAAPAVLAQIHAACATADFADLLPRTVDAAARALAAAGEPVNSITVYEYIVTHGALDGPLLKHLGSELHRLVADSPVAVAGPYEAGIVRRNALRRTVFGAADRLRDTAARLDHRSLENAVAVLSYCEVAL